MRLGDLIRIPQRKVYQCATRKHHVLSITIPYWKTNNLPSARPFAMLLAPVSQAFNVVLFLLLPIPAPIDIGALKPFWWCVNICHDKSPLRLGSAESAAICLAFIPTAVLQSNKKNRMARLTQSIRSTTCVGAILI